MFGSQKKSNNNQNQSHGYGNARGHSNHSQVNPYSDQTSHDGQYYSSHQNQVSYNHSQAQNQTPHLPNRNIGWTNGNSQQGEADHIFGQFAPKQYNYKNERTPVQPITQRFYTDFDAENIQQRDFHKEFEALPGPSSEYRNLNNGNINPAYNPQNQNKFGEQKEAYNPQSIIPRQQSPYPQSSNQQQVLPPKPSTFSLPNSKMNNNVNTIGRNMDSNFNTSFGMNSYYGNTAQTNNKNPMNQLNDYPEFLYDADNTGIETRSNKISRKNTLPAQGYNPRPVSSIARGSYANPIYGGAKKMNKVLYAVAFVMLFVSAGVFTFVFSNYQQTIKPEPAVAGITESKSSNKTSLMIDMDKYTTWIKEKNDGKYSPPEEDLLGGGLTNAEKFVLGLDPKTNNFCSKDKTDVQNLISLIDPASCKAIDLNNETEVKKFSQFINIPRIKEQMIRSIESEKEINIETKSKDDSVLGLFEISNYSELDKITADTLKEASKSSDQKLTYLEMVEKIDIYIEKFRSYEQYDRDYKSPVHAAVYLDTSIKHNVPLRYVMAIARSESRFGTDRFDREGNPNRIGANQNIFSIGLDDSGNNKRYNSWEEGVEGFGKWYSYFENKKVSDCSKWRIYNPNGDYCAKIESLSKEIQRFLDE